MIRIVEKALNDPEPELFIALVCGSIVVISTILAILIAVGLTYA